MRDRSRSSAVVAAAEAKRDHGDSGRPARSPARPESRQDRELRWPNDGRALRHLRRSHRSLRAIYQTRRRADRRHAQQLTSPSRFPTIAFIKTGAPLSGEMAVPKERMDDASPISAADTVTGNAVKGSRVEDVSGDAGLTPRERVGLYFAVGLGAGAVIALQIDIMRVFSVGSWAHFGSLVVSLAMLGFGLTSAVMTVAKDWFSRHWRIAASVALGLFGPLAVGANLYVQQLGFNAI